MVFKTVDAFLPGSNSFQSVRKQKVISFSAGPRQLCHVRGLLCLCAFLCLCPCWPLANSEVALRTFQGLFVSVLMPGGKKAVRRGKELFSPLHTLSLLGASQPYSCPSEPASFASFLDCRQHARALLPCVPRPLHCPVNWQLALEMPLGEDFTDGVEVS